IVMAAFRYGIPAGIAYAGMLVAFLWRAVVCGFHTKNFFSMGIAAVSFAICMTESVEMPFCQIMWLVFYFGVCSVLHLWNGERKDGISEYKD
ncbi:MAG: hypothetical protein LUI07_07235, partial [Lachnospiraceae bacterium]|nr:hypothetical protein [Lachnospiraceae bacterium]